MGCTSPYKGVPQAESNFFFYCMATNANRKLSLKLVKIMYWKRKCYFMVNKYVWNTQIHLDSLIYVKSIFPIICPPEPVSKNSHKLRASSVACKVLYVLQQFFNWQNPAFSSQNHRVLHIQNGDKQNIQAKPTEHINSIAHGIGS